MNSFWVVVLSLAAVILLSGYIRALVKRIVLLQKLKKCCKKSGHTLERTGSLFARNSSPRTCFRITAGRDIYLIKLFGSAHKHETFYFNEQGSYHVERIIPLGIIGPGGSVAHTKSGREKLIPEIDWYGDITPEYAKNYIPVLLFCPAPMEIRTVNHTAPEKKQLFTAPAGRDPYLTSLANRPFDANRNHGGWAAGGYNIVSGSVRKYSAAFINGFYIYDTHDFLKILENGADASRIGDL